MNKFPLWKNLLVLVVLVLGMLFALPNLFPEDPAVQIAARDDSALDSAELARVREILAGETLEYRSATLRDGRISVRFDSVDDQLRAADTVRAILNPRTQDYVVALVLAPRLPAWVRTLGLQPMSLGLDLRGGVHFLFEVDMDAAIDQVLRRYQEGISVMLRDERIPRRVRVDGEQVVVTVNSEEDAQRAEALLRRMDDPLQIRRAPDGERPALYLTLSEDQVQERRDFAIQQNTITLRNRVNELGVAEPLVARQGADRIVVQLPGVQDPRQAEVVLGATATLEFRLVDTENDPIEAARRGRAPINTELYYERSGAPVLLSRDIIVTGDQLTNASSGFSEGRPAVFVNLDSQGARRMLQTTQANLGRPMAVLFIEERRNLVEQDGELVEVSETIREVISVATIQGVFSSRFQITGLATTEARDLALLLRAGALAAPIFKVEERTIGPSLGQDNIDRGMQAVVLGFALVVIFMIAYYRVFGLVANLALLTNVVLVVALLSLLQASLTLPGIAGIVLTVGMAVDANVLIFERIREELRNGNSPQAAIAAGYDKAFSSIADANITTLIAAVVLFTFGTGPIKGFAVTLSLGIITSMFTAIIGTRAVINLIYGGRRVQRLSIGGSMVHAPG
ncbi:MAG: protein translocase subunit SecD [Gammaproteobacteria bacterium]|nr:protein translocase subunit SecD [Gammaproteobacteria bacterium]TVQ47427.1 MAG: protein translocase subunit SecD [Gammaproteobacteria bacterium]